MNPRDRRARAIYDLTAPIQDWLFQATGWLDGVDATRERRKLIECLNLGAGQCVLEVGPGTGRNIPLIARQMGANGRILAVDISAEMLKQCRHRLRMVQPGVDLLEGNVSRLPLATHVVDRVLHFGGFNQFGDKRQAIGEMMRVAKPGATIVISDKCISPQRHWSWRQKLRAKLFPHLVAEPPLAMIPLPPQQIEIHWFWNEMAYILCFRNP